MIDRNTLTNNIRDIVAEITEIDKGKISLDANFVTDLGMDSMMALEILAAMEKKFKIMVPEDKLRKLTTLRESIKLTMEYMN